VNFTLAHGVLASLILHGALLAPIFALGGASPEKPSLLVVELQGVAGDSQSEDEAQSQVRGSVGRSAPEPPPEPAPKPESAQQPAQQPMPQPEQAAEASQTLPPPRDRAPDATEASPAAPPTQVAESVSPHEPAQPTEQKPAEQPLAAPPAAPPVAPVAGAENVKGADEASASQTLADARRDAGRLQAYSALLSRKVQHSLIYPRAGRAAGLQGITRIAFAIDGDGRIRPGSLRVAESSGQLQLDASALESVRHCDPFDPPPHPISIVIAVNYGRRR
jgi:periplasmic protein TonB